MEKEELRARPSAAHSRWRSRSQAIAYAVFALIGTIGVASPVVIYFVMGERSQEMLTKLKNWMGHNNAVIMAILCLIIGAKLIGDAIGGLTG